MAMVMHPRLGEEWDDIVQAYPDAGHLLTPERIEATLDLDLEQYNNPTTRVAVLIPPGYRATGPDGFLVPAGLILKAGDLPASDATGAGMPGWLLMSFHMIDERGQSTWRPTADPCSGDNMVGYLQSVEAFLARGCN